MVTVATLRIRKAALERQVLARKRRKAFLDNQIRVRMAKAKQLRKIGGRIKSKFQRDVGG